LGERLFQKSFEKSFPEGFIYKLIDTHSLEGAKRMAEKFSPGSWGKIIIPRVPGDYICIEDGKHLVVECKNTMNKSSFPLGNIKSHQFDFVMKIEAAGGKYYFAIRKQEARKNECFLVTVNDIIRLKTANGGRQSIKWEQFRNDKNVKKPPSIKGSLFDMECLFC